MSIGQKSQDLNARLLDLLRCTSQADDLLDALTLLLKDAQELVPSDGAAVMFLLGDHLVVRAKSGAPAPLKDLSLPVSQMGAGRAVLDSGRVVRVDDTAEDGRWERVPGEEQVRSWLGAPFRVNGQSFGLLEWTAREPNWFDADSEWLAERVVDTVAAVINKAQLLDDTRLRLRQVVEPQLDSAPRALDLGAELQPIVDEAAELTGARHAFAFVRSRASHRLHCVAASGEKSRELRQTTLRGDGSFGGWRVSSGGSSDWLYAEASDREAMAALGIEKTLILPIRAMGEEVGMLGVAESSRKRGFGRDALRLMTHLASQASLIVERVYPARAEKRQYDYEQVILSSPLGMSVLTMTGEIRVSNPALASLLSHPWRSLVGQSLFDFLVKEDARHLENSLQAALTGQRQTLDVRVRARSGDPRYVRISLAPAKASEDAGGNLVALLEDVTPVKILEDERVKHLQELKEKNAQLKELDELKSRFVSNVSHELRTPLAVIKLYATLARKGRPDKQAHYLQTIEQETQRLETMVENILDLSRMDRQVLRVDPEWLVPEQIIEQVLEVYGETARKRGIVLENRVKGRLPRLWADKNHLIQMLTNLVDNAIKYSQPEGKVSISAGETLLQSKRVLEIAVADTGLGIPEEEQSRIFERFFRGSNNTPSLTGTGLGLAIVQELMQRHGGQVTVQSQVGKGSVFTLQFPLTDGSVSSRVLVDDEDDED